MHATRLFRWLWLCSLLALSSLVRFGWSVGCNLIGEACICTDGEDKEWDISKLVASGEFTTNGPTTGCSICIAPWTYHMNICTNVDVPTAIGCTPSANTAAYRIDAYSTPTSRSCELLGPDVVGNGQLGVQALAEADGDEGDGVRLTYNYLTRTVTVDIICDTTGDGSVSDTDVGGNTIALTWPTPELCIGGTSAGVYFLVAFACASALYCGVGTAYNRNQPQQGVRADPPLVESVPHIEMWRSLPGLVKDGIHYSRVQVGALHPSLGCIAPGLKDYNDLDGGKEAGGHTGERERKKKSKKSHGEANDAETGHKGKREKSKSDRPPKKQVKEKERKPKPKPSPSRGETIPTASA